MAQELSSDGRIDRLGTVGAAPISWCAHAPPGRARALAKQLSFINSDLFKSTLLGQQSTLNAITAQLTKNIDFGLGGAFAQLAQLARQIADQQSAWLNSLGPNLEWLKGSFYPANLEDIDDLLLEDVQQVVMVDGIGLYAVPRSTIAEALIRADGSAKRRHILGRRWNDIASDCREAVMSCASTGVKRYVSLTLACLDALEAGHVEPPKSRPSLPDRVPIGRLAAHYPDATIARLLARQGRITATGLPFNADRVAHVRYKNDIPGYQVVSRGETVQENQGETVNVAEAEISVSTWLIEPGDVGVDIAHSSGDREQPQCRQNA